MLSTADIRSNFVERSWTVSRPRVARAILDTMETEPWLSSGEDNYRKFMKAVNHLGGGKLFELMGEKELAEFIQRCLETAQVQV